MTCGGCSGAIERVLKKNVEAREYTLLPYSDFLLEKFDGTRH